MKTLVFPDTGDIGGRLYPSLLFCKPLHILQLAEVDASASEKDTQEFYDQDLCRPFTPAPFGDKLERYLQIRQTISTYTEQVTGGTPAAGLEEKNRQFSSFLEESAAELTTDKYGEEIRKAQLTLALSEMLAQQEETLRDQLYFLDEDEIAALRNLRDQNGAALNSMVDNLQAVAARLATPDLQSEARRVAAWQRLLQKQSPPDIELWLASTRQAAEAVFDRYRTGNGKGAVPVLGLALPAHFRESTSYVIKHIEKFRDATADIHGGLRDDFHRLLAEETYRRDSTEFLLPYETDWGDRWETVLDEVFPASSYGRAGMTFYLLADQPVAGLFNQAGETPSGDYRHGLLAVFEETPAAS